MAKDGNQISPAAAKPSTLADGGELGKLIREYDWGSTSLGNPEDWPQSLKMAVGIMLSSRQPIWIGWGDDLVYLYNDAYKSIIGGKHPWALGKPTREVWREIWSDIGPLLQTALGGTQGTYVEAQLLIMQRHGYPEETYYTFSYSPIPNDDGSVGGIFCANTEDTQRVIGERQLALLRILAADTAHARHWQQACERTAAALLTNGQDLPFAMIYMAAPEQGVFHLVAASGIRPGDPGAPQTTDGRSLWPLDEVIEAHAPKLLDGLSEIVSAELPRGPWPVAPDKAAIIPLTAAVDSASYAVLIVGLNPYRLFDHDYRSFLGLVAGQVSAAIANAQAYQEERRRAEALAEIDRAKTAFFSNVSHEFRTPLTLMLGPLEDALQDQSSAGLPPVQRMRLETAHRNSMRLLKLVNSLLDFSRIEAGRVQANFQPVDLAKLTRELASNFESATSRAGLTLRINCPPLAQPVYVDTDMWEKIVLNLLSNAFKFTFAGEIAIELASDGHTARLVVSDTGVGIPEAELPRLFERFHRVQGQKSRSFEGSGIGLALVQELVRLHGGTIDVTSLLGRGSVFNVTVPLGAGHLPKEYVRTDGPRERTPVRAQAYVEEALRWLPETEPVPDTPVEGIGELADLIESTAGGHARILVADDNADMRAYIRRLLGNRWEVETVADGIAALAEIRARKPDLILSDVMMPGKDGFALLRELRGDSELRDLPVILLSARAGEEARLGGLDAGADDYLVKPFSARELIARVSANLELSRIRRESMRDLRESEARFRNMADHAPVMMWVTDRTGSLTYLNRLWTEFTGQELGQALGDGAWTALHPDDIQRSRDIFLAANVERKPFTIEFRLRRRDGDYRWALSAAGPRFGDDGAFLGYIASVIDISERKQAEQILRQTNEHLERRIASAISERMEVEAQLRHSQKMEAIGRLTGGVAHDFNNVLQVISGNLQLLGRDVVGNRRAEQRLQTAATAISRGAKLASQLLAFGRRQPLTPKVINLGRLVRGIDDMLRRAIGEGIEIDTQIAGGLWNTFVDAVQVENALLNLSINARDAMDGHGKLTINARNEFIDEGDVSRHPDIGRGQYVLLAVTDTGCGMSAEVLEHAFEPFFTTKPEGKGTGLGLSMVYGFVKQSGGHIAIDSEPGRGTTVRIYLPRSVAPEDNETILDPAPAVGGTETVLVVEDDEDVRATACEMLLDLGYHVLKAKDAQSALAIVESGLQIDVLFTDVVMPGTLRSPELARKARERLPNIAVLFTSGYTEDVILHDGRLDEGIELLSKPYTRDALATKIGQVLRRQR